MNTEDLIEASIVLMEGSRTIPMKFPYNKPTLFRIVLTFSGIFLPVYCLLDGTVVWMDKKYNHAEYMFDENDERTWA